MSITKDDKMIREISDFKRKKLDDLDNKRRHKHESEEAKNAWKQAIQDIKDIDYAVRDGARTLVQLKQALTCNLSLQYEIDIILQENGNNNNESPDEDISNIMQDSMILDDQQKSFWQKKHDELTENWKHRYDSTEAYKKWKQSEIDIKSIDMAIKNGVKSLEELKKASQNNPSLQDEIGNILVRVENEENKRNIANEFNDPNCRIKNFFVTDTNGVMSKHDKDSSFEGNCNLTSAYLPYIIKDRVFKGCESLEKVVFPDSKFFRYISIESFMGCKSLNTISIPSTVTTIYRSAFEGCASMEKIEIPEKVKTIEDGVFRGCTSLREVVLPSSLESIDRSAFEDCKSLIRIELPEGLGYIGREAFKGCQNLRDVVIPSSVEKLYDNTFEGCTSLIKIELPEGLGYIGREAFKGCRNLREVVIPSSVEQLYDNTFEGCTSLAKIVILNGVKTISDDAFRGLTNLKEVVIPSSVKRIGRSSFAECLSLESIEIPKGVKNVFDKTFEGCTSLKRIELPEGLEYIGEEAFKGCVNLKEVVIPSSVECIRDNSFEDYTHIVRMTNPRDLLYTIYKDGKIETLVEKNISSINGKFSSYRCDRSWFDSCFGYRFGDNLELYYVEDYDWEQLFSNEFSKNPEKIKIIEPTSPKLLSVKLPYGINKIEDSEFEGCFWLTSVVIPESVSSIGRNAFSYCI